MYYTRTCVRAQRQYHKSGARNDLGWSEGSCAAVGVKEKTDFRENFAEKSILSANRKHSRIRPHRRQTRGVSVTSRPLPSCPYSDRSFSGHLSDSPPKVRGAYLSVSVCALRYTLRGIDTHINPTAKPISVFTG